MKIDTDSEEMFWVLAKFLRDSLDFLALDKRALGMKREVLIKEWQKIELTEARMKDWLPGFKKSSEKEHPDSSEE